MTRIINPTIFAGGGGGVVDGGFPAAGVFVEADGIDDYVEIPYTQTPSDGITISFQMRPRAIASLDGVIGVDVSGEEFWVYLLTGGKVSFRTILSGGTARKDTPSSTVADNVWSHFAWTRTGDTASGYIDGTAYAVPLGGSNPGTAPSSGEWRLGSGHQTVEGDIDFRDFRIYSAVLTTAELEYLETEGVSGNDPGTDDLEVHYQFDDGSGTTAENTGNAFAADGLCTNITELTWWNP